MSRVHVVKKIQILIFYFSCYYSAWDFLRLIFSPGIFFFGGGGLSEALGIFFRGGLIFVPIRSWSSLEISISWKTF